MRSTSINIGYLGILFLPMMFLLGLYSDAIGIKLFAFMGLAVAAYAVMLVPFRLSLVFVFLYIGFEGFFKIISNYHPVVHVGSDIMVIALCCKVLIGIFFKGADFSKTPPLTKLFIIHFCWLFIVLFNPYSLSFISSIAGAKIYISMFLLYFFGYYLTQSQKDVRFYMIPFIVVAVLHTIFGLIQGFQGPEALIDLHPRYAIQLQKFEGTAFRPFGLANLPGAPSIYMYIVFPFLLYFAYYLKSFWAKLLILGFLPFSILLFFLCQVRSAILKMMFASLLFFVGGMNIYSKSRIVIMQAVAFAVLFIGVTVFYILPEFIDASIETRAENEQAIERSLSLFDYDKVSRARRGVSDRFLVYIKEIPLGAGFARVGAAAGAFSGLREGDRFFESDYFFADNFWLTALIEVGIPGMLIITIIFLSILWIGYKSYFEGQDQSLRMLQMAILASLSAVVLGLYGAEGIIYNPEACFFWFFSGVLMKLVEMQKKQKVKA